MPNLTGTLSRSTRLSSQFPTASDAVRRNGDSETAHLVLIRTAVVDAATRSVDVALEKAYVSIDGSVLTYLASDERRATMARCRRDADQNRGNSPAWRLHGHVDSGRLITVRY